MEDQTILASDETLGNITVCPGGVVHINLPHCSLKLLPSDFVKLSELVSKARMRFDPPIRGDGKPRLQVVTNDTQDGAGSDPNSDSIPPF